MAATLDDVADACRKLDALTAPHDGPVGMLTRLALDDASLAAAEAGRGDWLRQLDEAGIVPPSPVPA